MPKRSRTRRAASRWQCWLTRPMAIQAKPALISLSIYMTAVPGKRDRFTDDREATSKALAAEMGKWKTKDPCIYFHLNGSCSFTADTCRCYH